MQFHEEILLLQENYKKLDERVAAIEALIDEHKQRVSEDANQVEITPEYLDSLDAEGLSQLYKDKRVSEAAFGFFVTRAVKRALNIEVSPLPDAKKAPAETESSTEAAASEAIDGAPGQQAASDTHAEEIADAENNHGQDAPEPEATDELQPEAAAEEVAQ